MLEAIKINQQRNKLINKILSSFRSNLNNYEEILKK